MKPSAAVITLILAAAGVCAGALARAPSHAQPVSHHRATPTANPVVSINPPGDLGFALKEGPNKAQAQQYCLMCHSTAYVSTQPPLTHDQWTAEVVKMQKVYGAPIPDTAVAPIADYLSAAYGSPPPASAPPTVPTSVPSGASR